MKITRTTITHKKHELKYAPDLGLIIDVTNTNNPEYYYDNNDLYHPLNTIDHAIHSFKINWRDVAESENAEEQFKDLFVLALEKATREQRKRVAAEYEDFFDYSYRPLDNAELHEMLNELSASDLDLTSNLALAKELIDQHTDFTVYPVSVYTHSDSSFTLCQADQTHDYLVLPDREEKPWSDDTVAKLIDIYQDYFNGYIYTFDAWDNLEDAVNDSFPINLVLTATEFDDIEKTLQEKLGKEA